MSDPRMARRGGQNGSTKLLKSRDKYNNEATSFERHWESHFIHFIRNPLTSMSETQFRDRLISTGNAPETRERVTQGLLFGLLNEPENTPKYFSYLGEIATDNWYSALCNMNMILFEYFTKITDDAKKQIVEFFRLAIKANVGKIDNVIMNFIRYGSDGTDFASRVRLIKSVVEMLSEKEGKEWILGLKGLSLLMPTLLNIVVRIVVDMPQGTPNDSTRTLFLNFAFFLVARRLQCCLYLGRDLLLILLRLSKTTQFAPLWRDLIKNPGQFGGAFKNVEDLLNRPPNNTVYPLKLSIPMQRQVEFMLTHLKHGSHEKYLEWFTEWNLRATDSSSLRADIIRFVLAATHVKEFNPEMRAVVAYSMLTTTVSGPEMQWAKLVLWWDWFGYTGTENPTAIESTFTVLRCAMNTQPVIAQTLLEFAMKEIPKLHPPITSSIRASFNNAFRTIGEKQGPSGVSYVLENGRMDLAIRELCKNELSGRSSSNSPANDKRGAPLGGSRGTTKPVGAPSIVNTSEKLKSASPTPPQKPSTAPPPPPPASSTVPQRGIKKDTEKIEKNGEKKEEEKKEKDDKGGTDKKEIEKYIKGFKGELKNLVIEMNTIFKDDKSDEGEKCASVEKVIKYVQENEEIHDDDNILEALGNILGYLLKPIVSIESNSILPENKAVHTLENESLTECFNSPLYVVFKSLSLSDSRSAIETIISWMREKDNAVTYLLLFFLKVYSEDSNLPVASYENIANHFDSNTLDSRLTEDLELMAKDDRNLFTLCLPFVFKSFPIVASACVGLFKTLCHFADNNILCQFLGSVYREDLVIFRKESFNPIFIDSLEWEGVAEMMFWQLVNADGVNAEWFFSYYSKINSLKNSIAAAQLLILLKRHEPNIVLVRSVMSRSLNTDDHFTTSAMKLMIEDEDCCTKTADVLSGMMKKQISSGEILVSSVNSKNSKSKNANKTSLDHVLYHLTELSKRCLVKEKKLTEQLFTSAAFRDAIQCVKKSEKCSVLVSKYDSLFTLVELLDEQKTTSRSLRGNRSGSMRGTKREATSTEDETKKKRKPVYIVESDSE